MIYLDGLGVNVAWDRSFETKPFYLGYSGKNYLVLERMQCSGDAHQGTKKVDFMASFNTLCHKKVILFIPCAMILFEGHTTN